MNFPATAFLLCTLLFFNGRAFSSDVYDSNSPEFPLGKMTRPNLVLPSKDNPNLGISAGIRFQGSAEWTEAGGNSSLDLYGRRVRFEFGPRFSENMSFAMDVRNDNVNRGDGGEREFNVGDAYLTVKNLFGSSLFNFKGLRAKVDVSRTETVKSSWQLYYDRAPVADEAAQYVSHNRRAMNAQLYGTLNEKVAYSLAVGDGVHSDSFHDALGNSADSIVRQNPMIGAKVILSPFEGWEETERTETYFGRGRHASVGAGFFYTSNIQFKPTATASTSTVNRKLLNVEASAHYESVFFQAEYFRFYDVVENFSAPTLNVGESEGWYAQGEYVLPSLAYLGVFYRYHQWNHFLAVPGYGQTGHAAGLNWYLRGNTVRVGFAAQTDTYESRLGGNTVVSYKLTSQLHF